MEKASKKVNEVEIEMKDGSKRSLASLKESDLENVKQVDGAIPLRRGLVKDADGHYIERRLVKHADKAKIALYDLDIPTSEGEFNKLPFVHRLDNYVKGLRIDADASRLTSGLDEATKQFIELTKKVAKGEKLTPDEKKFVKAYGKTLGIESN